MPAIERPGFEYDYAVEHESQYIRTDQLHREIPQRKPQNLLIASWNMANLGDPAQQRLLSDLIIMATSFARAR